MQEQLRAPKKYQILVLASLVRMVEPAFRKEQSFSAYALKDLKGQRVKKEVPQYRFTMIYQTLIKYKTQGVFSMNFVCYTKEAFIWKTFGE